MFRIEVPKKVEVIPSWKGTLAKLQSYGVELTEAVQALKLVDLGSTCWVQGRGNRIEVSGE